MTENVTPPPSSTDVVQQQTFKSTTTDINNPNRIGTDANDHSVELKDVNEFKAKYPDVYKKFCESIANNIIKDMKKHDDRMKEIRIESERN